MTQPEIMTVQEVAEFLRVSERTVYDWATNGVIPCGKLGTSWRFQRSEVQNWVNDQLSGGAKKGPSFSPVSIKEILDPNHVLVFNTESKDTALMLILNRLDETGAVEDTKKVTEGIFQREKLMSTGIGLGIGLPHVRLDCIPDLLMAVGLSTNDILDYESLDNKPVRLLFMILAGKHQHSQHIKTIAALSAKIKNPLFREKILQATDPATIYQYLTETSVHPDHSRGTVQDAETKRYRELS